MNENFDRIKIIEKILLLTKNVRRIPFSDFSRIYIPSEQFRLTLKGLEDRGLIDLKKGTLEVSKTQRIRLAFTALTEHMSLEMICRSLEWDEFEQLLSTLFSHHDYTVRRNLHIKHRGKRLQIDILAVKDQLILCVDCKHWRYGYSQSRMKTAAKKQEARAKAVTPSLLISQENTRNRRFYVVPVILVLLDIPFRFIGNIPIVPVHRLNDFLDNFPPIPDSRFKYFTVKDVDDSIHLSYEGFP
ncbi:NERD domain-containing protein [[Eubacterium] cellulosolvens]